jgi:CHAT domain-containing protein
MTAITNLAFFYDDLDLYAKAEPLYQKLLQDKRGVFGPRYPATLLTMAMLADLYKAEGRYDEAEPLYKEALQARLKQLGPRHPNSISMQLKMAEFLASQNRDSEAVRMLQEMEPNLLTWIGQELYSTVTGSARRNLVSSHADFQNVVLSIAIAKGGDDAVRLAGTVMLHFKVVQGEEEAYLARLTRSSEHVQVQSLAAEIIKLRAALASAVKAGSDTFEGTLQSLEAKQQALIVASPEYQNHLQVLNSGLDRVRVALPPGAVLIEFREFASIDFRARRPGENRLVGMLLSSDAEPLVADLGSISELQRLAISLDDQGATKLYQRLTAPFEQRLSAARAVYVAPDGFLNLVPLARLNLLDGSHWLERQEVHVLQTGRDLVRPDVGAPARGLLALGGIDFGAVPIDTALNDSIFFAAAGSDRTTAITRTAATFRSGFAQLPGSADEVKDVIEWFRLLRSDEPSELWTGAMASKARLIDLKSPPRVLHLATHGFYRPNESREPMLLSGIALAGANRDLAGVGADGLLFALEAEGLNLDGTELVVLSACDTAQGSIDYSEGVFGLARALRTAGARNVLVTLWKLKDGEAHEFMVDFYKNWLTQSRSDPAKALRDTRLAWIHRDPSDWAPYVLVE